MSKGFLYDTGDELITREDVNEVPDGSTASAGDVLSLDSNKKPKWSTPESGLPDTTGASAGDVLSLDEDKEPVWSTPSGGGEFIKMSTGSSGEGKTVSFSDGETRLSFATLKAKGEFYCEDNMGFVRHVSVDEDAEGKFIDAGVIYYIDMSSDQPSSIDLYFIGPLDETTDNDTIFPLTGTGGSLTITYQA